MKLKTKGVACCIDNSIVARVTFDPLQKSESTVLLVSDRLDASVIANFDAIITTWPLDEQFDYPSVYEVPDFDHLEEGDIVAIHSDGIINTLYRVRSQHNFLLFTERCNSNCLMCSQPPRDKEDSHLAQLYKRVIPLIPKDCTDLGITGGEPTLLGNLFFELLILISSELPLANIHCLTNGRSFAWPDFTYKLNDAIGGNLVLGIPLYADSYLVHDYVVQAKGAFDQTLLGLYQLARFNRRIEIRIVLHKLTIPRLKKLARFIYRNLPFVEHVAFMGLEYQGYTPHNIDKLWIDPKDYAEELSDAMLFLADMGMQISLYNSQLCLTPKELWPFYKRSISDWKNIYLPICDSCSMQDECGGFFASSLKFHSNNITPFI
ncbi:His-Xaa-Ser system radical SAM maturase HxsC [Flavihumibacter sp. UBA7668]|uniref:His-Xaa-Ser system radical SAM maturase HxsC n=1 Tax=Flavihumibacter sp. UBA7668 TaxID=1946542 RepID=UPI0025C58289|nr:His-Xaa-Ser system radical SAM maturase HxsC [Flavihumibacter sp. UBA7668]